MQNKCSVKCLKAGAAILLATNNKRKIKRGEKHYDACCLVGHHTGAVIENQSAGTRPMVEHSTQANKQAKKKKKYN